MNFLVFYLIEVFKSNINKHRCWIEFFFCRNLSIFIKVQPALFDFLRLDGSPYKIVTILISAILSSNFLGMQLLVEY